METVRDLIFYFLVLYGFLSLLQDIDKIFEARRQSKTHPSQQQE
jgi:hypothetical protein